MCRKKLDNGKTQLVTRKSRIFFRCDPLAKPPGKNDLDGLHARSRDGSGWQVVPGMGVLEGQQLSLASTCDDIELEWWTSSACPLCRASDYAPVRKGYCTGGK